MCVSLEVQVETVEPHGQLIISFCTINQGLL